MARQHLTDAVIALHHVEHAVGQPGRGVDLGELERRQRRQLGRLEDEGVTACKSWRRLPHRNLYGVVPCADPCTNAERFALDRCEAAGREVEVLTVQHRDEAGVVLDLVGAADDVDRGRLRQRLARIECFEMRDLVVACSEDLHRLEHDAHALHCRHRRPDSETGLRGSHGVVDVTLACLLHLADHPVRCGVDRLKGLT